MNLREMAAYQFITDEISKALLRLKRTTLFVLKAFFIAVLNLLFWFLPLVVMGYLIFRPVARRMTEESLPADAPVHQDAYQGKTARQTTPGELLSWTQSIVREVRNFRRY